MIGLLFVGLMVTTNPTTGQKCKITINKTKTEIDVTCRNGKCEERKKKVYLFEEICVDADGNEVVRTMYSIDELP